jgi:hypothetical protein
MGSIKGGQVTGYKYFMDILMGVCRGPVDQVIQIVIGGQYLWYNRGWGSGPNITYSGEPGCSWIDNVNVQAKMSQPKIFGGDTGEGGVEGTMNAYQGLPNQGVDTNVQTPLGSPMSGMHGFLAIWFQGQVCSNNPYPKTWMFRVSRTINGWFNPSQYGSDMCWYQSACAIDLLGWDFMQDQSDPHFNQWFQGPIYAMNPIHMIYEALTNPDWGKGYDPSLIDDANFRAAADVCVSEGLGLCFAWDRTNPIEDIIGQIIDHIAAALFLNRQTGLFNIIMIRQDYSESDYPAFNFSNGLLDVTEDESSAQDTGLNEIIVVYHTPLRNDDREVRSQNIASIQALGEIFSDTRNYPMIAEDDLAHRAALRDLNAAVVGLRRFTLVFDRRGYNLQPGGLVAIELPDRGLEYMVLRIGKVTIGGLKGGKITVQAVTDIFDFPATAYTSSTEPTYTPPPTQAIPATVRLVVEASYRDVVIRLGAANAQTLPEDAGYIATFIGRPTSNSLNYLLQTSTDDPTDADGAQYNTGVAWSATATITSAIGLSDGDVYLLSGTDFGEIAAGDAMYIEGEIVEIVAFNDATGHAVVKRGCVDTLPAGHAAGAPYFLIDGATGSDQQEYVSGESVYVKTLPRLTSQTLDPSLAAVDTVVMASRLGRPWISALMKINGTSYADGPRSSTGTDMVLTWANRNRLLVQDVLLGQDDGDAGPLETGQTYTIDIYAADNSTLLRTTTGIVGNTWSYTAAMQAEDGAGGSIWIAIESVRDTLVSWNTYRFQVSFSDAEGGDGWGNEYGGGWG